MIVVAVVTIELSDTAYKGPFPPITFVTVKLEVVTIYGSGVGIKSLATVL